MTRRCVAYRRPTSWCERPATGRVHRGDTEFEKGRSLPGFTHKVLVLGASHRHG